MLDRFGTTLRVVGSIAIIGLLSAVLSVLSDTLKELKEVNASACGGLGKPCLVVVKEGKIRISSGEVRVENIRDICDDGFASCVVRIKGAPNEPPKTPSNIFTGR